ncbi:MAG: undecaprenyl-diphosphate phosphatase [Ruminococcaceae bacterium]|nr:undecaprenyl-diphosphate phosphatase [Oscillospiraceae bacterium]
MGIFEAIIYGVVQGVAEFLPISSSGHLALAQNFFGTSGTEDLFTFNILLHFGTLVAVFVMYAADVWKLIKSVFSLIARPFNGRLKEPLNGGEKLFLILCIACLPLVPAALLSDKVEALSDVSWAIGVLLLINGCMLFVSDRLSRNSETVEQSKLRRGLYIGLFQLFGVLPGISRSGSTITGGLFNNLDRKEALRFSFLLSIPAILGANLLELLELKGDLFAAVGAPACLAGMAAAAISGIFAIKILNYFAVKKNFSAFAVYCFIVGTAAIIGDLFIK